MVEHCSNHSGVCENIKTLQIQLHKVDERHEHCAGDKVSNKLFYTLITILVLLFGSLFGINWGLYTRLSMIDAIQATQTTQLQYMSSTLTDIKADMKRLTK